MVNYRRLNIDGGTYFFTVTLKNRFKLKKWPRRIVALCNWDIFATQSVFEDDLAFAVDGLCNIRVRADAVDPAIIQRYLIR